VHKFITVYSLRLSTLFDFHQQAQNKYSRFVKIFRRHLAKALIAIIIKFNFLSNFKIITEPRESFLNAMEENSLQFPDKTYETIHTIEDGDLVAVHGKVELGPNVYGVIHIFRFEDGKIIESWEASQEEFKDSPNENGLF